MALQQIKNKLKQSPALKSFLYYMICQTHGARPRWWIRTFIHPIWIKKGKGSHIRSSARRDIFPFNYFHMGKYSYIESFCTINNGVGDIYIGDYSRVGVGNTIIGPIEIGNHVNLAQNVVLSGLNHTYEAVDKLIDEQTVSTKKIVIEDDCWIGANSVIVAGVRIGRHSVVGAGSVVSKDVPPYTIVVGNPAKIVKQYDSEKNCWIKTGKEK